MEEQLRFLSPRRPSADIKISLFGEATVREEPIRLPRLLYCLAPAAACVVLALGAFHFNGAPDGFHPAHGSAVFFASIGSNAVLKSSEQESLLAGAAGGSDRNIWSTVVCRSTNEQRWDGYTESLPRIGIHLLQ